jgi:acetyl-CoA carboxylase carboxyltransferase component
VMGAKQAVGFVHRKEIEASGDPERARDAFAAAYARDHLTAEAATADGFVDEVIVPSETRARLAAAFNVLDTAIRPPRPAGNLPL